MTPVAAESPRPAGDLNGPRRVLHAFVVEDNPVILENLVAALEELTSVQVVGHAADEESALAQLAARRGELDLVIVDVFLKSGSGLGVLRGALSTSLPAPRVVLTNCVSVEVLAQCRALGADCVFDKSKDLDELMAYCCRLAERGAQR